MTRLPEPGFLDVISAWGLEPLVTVPIAAAGVFYVAVAARLAAGRRGAGWPRRRTWAFLTGLAALAVALLSPVEAYSGVFLWVHMVQHLLLTLVAAPLLLLGAPMTLVLRASSPAAGRRLVRLATGRAIAAVTHPIVAWLAFTVMLVGIHFSPLYQAALEREWVHWLEHALFLGTGLLFWWPVIGVDPARSRPTHPIRILYLLAAAPVNTLIALAISVSGEVLYPHYAQVERNWGPSPMEDQAAAGAIMWISGDLGLVVAVGLVLLSWMRRESGLGKQQGSAWGSLQARGTASAHLAEQELDHVLRSQQIRRHQRDTGQVRLDPPPAQGSARRADTADLLPHDPVGASSSTGDDETGGIDVQRNHPRPQAGGDDASRRHAQRPEGGPPGQHGPR